MHNLTSRPGFEVVKIDQNGVEFPLPIHWCHGVPGHHCVNSLCINMPKLHYSICHVELSRFETTFDVEIHSNYRFIPLKISGLLWLKWVSTNAAAAAFIDETDVKQAWKSVLSDRNVFPLITNTKPHTVSCSRLWFCARGTCVSIEQPVTFSVNLPPQTASARQSLHP